jgi:ribosomal-protein-alanine N-acetyltransferase
MDRLSAALPSASRASLHAAICDSCDMYIVGTRYHCTDAACEDFDLCDRCTLFEGRSHLQAHSLLVLSRPRASVAQLVSACHRADVTNDYCECGSSHVARFVCSVCMVSVCEPCSSHHDESHALIWVRSSRISCPHLPPLHGCKTGNQFKSMLLTTPKAQRVTSPSSALQPSSTSSFSVRPMLPGHIDAVMAIEIASFTQPYERDVFEKFVGRGGACWSLVAESCTADVCGYCLCDAATKSAASVRVISLGTAAMWRGQGVGALLLSHCISCARQHGATAVKLHVAVDNAAAIALYKRLGFQQQRTLVAYYRCATYNRNAAAAFAPATPPNNCCCREVAGAVDAWEMRLSLA